MELNARENPESRLYHFSRKVVILSVLFFAVNLALYFMVLYGQPARVHQALAPKVVFAAGQEVFQKSPYDEAYLPAKPNQGLFAGMLLKTGDQSFAEIQLEGNAIRLDQNTEIRMEDSQWGGANPRLAIRVQSGSVWVNAFDPISIRAPRAQVVFSHDVGVFTYSAPLNRVMSITQSADLSLLGADGNVLAALSIPLKSQVAFADAQIIPEYSRLEYSKLKKEVKLGPVPQSLLDEPWIQRNTADDLKVYVAENGYIFSKRTYDLRDGYYSVLEKLSFVPSQRQAARLARIRILFKYLLGGIQADNDLAGAKEFLKKFTTLSSEVGGSPLLEDQVSHQFYAIQNARPNTVAAVAREGLWEFLYSKESPEMLRTRLSDVDFLLRILEVDKAGKAAAEWLSNWDAGMVKRFPKEFDIQSREFHSIMIANSDRINSVLLGVLESAENARLANAANPADVLYEIALERLGISRYLVAAKRYAEAKNYLRTSYSKLNLGQSSASAPVREIFMKDATLLADRIAFAEQSLHASAGAMDESAFMSYLSMQERDKTLEQRFSAFIQGAKAPEVKKEPPKVEEVVQRFSASRITVSVADVAQKVDFPFEFVVKNARLMDRSLEGGAELSFDAEYESNVNAVFNIVLNGKSISGNYTLDDLVRIAITGETVLKPSANEGQSDDPATFRNLGSGEEIERSQVIAQDLAVQLAINELKLGGIQIGSPQQVSVVNKATLTRFHIRGAKVEDSTAKRTVNVNFDYDSVTKMMSAIELEKLFAELPSEVPAGQFATVVFDVIYGVERQEKAMQSAVLDLGTAGYLLNAKDAKFADAALNLIEFKSLRMKQMPVEIVGTYDRQGKVFVTAQNALLSQENVGLRDYAVQVSKLFVIEALSKKGISIGEANIKGALPAEKVAIENYSRGDKVINFTYDIVGNRLVDISLKGSLSKVETMTFEEFNLIGGGESATPPAPAVPAEPTAVSEGSGPRIPALPTVELFVPPSSGTNTIPAPVSAPSLPPSAPTAPLAP